MPRKHRQILPLRVPFFRIFYSTTYTVTFLITLFFLAITPGSLLWDAFSNNALQYIFIIASVYFVTAVTAIFIYSSRLYTNRSVLAGVGKAYIPIEDGEVGKGIRRLIVSHLERSAIVAWEARPRDIKGEAMSGHKEGLRTGRDVTNRSETTIIGTLVSVDVNNPPWGTVQHPGWTAPSDAASELQSNLQFELVISELANLIEARAVSLAPSLRDAHNVPDPRFVEILRRQEKMGMREYLTQLSYLQLIDLTGEGRDFLTRYERARFSGMPTTCEDFKLLMNAFGAVLDGIKQIDPAIAREIQAQVHPEYVQDPRDLSVDAARATSHSAASSIDEASPVTARTRFTGTPYLSQGNVSTDSVSSVLRPHTTPRVDAPTAIIASSSPDDSDTGSLIWHPV